MELPEFNPAGTGPQGEGGIPPESIRQGLRDTGTDLIGANMSPEDSPAAQAILQSEAAALLEAQGIADPTQAPASPDTPTTPTPQAQPPVAPAAKEHPPGPPTPDPDSFAEKVRRSLAKYSGNPEELAKANVHANDARTKAEQERNTRIRDLERQVEELGTRSAPPPYQQYPPPAYQPAPAYSPAPEAAPPAPAHAEEATAGSIWENPQGFKREILDGVQKTIQDNLVSYAQAQNRAQEEEQTRRITAENSAEMERLRPTMRRIYESDAELYSQMPQSRVLGSLLRQARNEEKAHRADLLFEEMGGIVGETPNGNSGDPQTFGSVPVSGATSARHAAPGTPPGAAPANGNWSDTPGFKRLWATKSGSTDEHKTMMDVLRERNFYEDFR